MADLLERIREELQSRLRQSRAAVQEYERLRHALTALDGAADKNQRAAEPDRTRPTTAATRRSRARRSPAPKPRQRAPRGQNRARILGAIGDRPGVTPPELAAASGVKGPTLYTVLRRLVDEDVVTKRELPGGDTGYVLSDDQ